LSLQNTAIYVNSRTKLEVPAGGQGEQYRASNTVNPDGTYNGQIVYDYAKAAVLSARTGDGALSLQNTAIYVNSRTKLEAPAGGQGEQYRASNTVNPDGTYNGQIVYDYAKAAVLSARTGDGALSLQNTAIYVNSRTKLEAPTGGQGEQYRASNTVNPDGTYNGQIVYDYAKEVIFDVTQSKTAFADDISKIYANSRSKIEAPDQVEAGIYQASSSINPDGTYKGELTYRGSKEIAIYTTWKTADGVVGCMIYKASKTNHTTAINALTYDTNNRVSLIPRSDGTYDAVIDIQPANGNTTEVQWWKNYTMSQHYENSKGETIYVFTLWTTYLGSETSGQSNSAIAFIQDTKATGGRKVIGQDSGNITTVRHLGRGRFKAVRVEKV
jgi:hypothetical protein